MEFVQKVIVYAAYPLLFITAFLAMQVTLHFLDVKEKWWNRFLLYIVHFFMATTLVFIGVGDYMPPLFVFILFVCGLCLLCKGRLLARFSMGLILVMLPLSFNAVLTTFRPPYDKFIFVFRTLFWVGILLFVRKTLPKGVKPPIRSGRLWGLIDLLVLMPVGTVFSLIAFTSPEYLHISPDPFRDTLYIPHERILIFILCLSVVEALALFIAVVVLSRNEKLEEEEVLWQMRNQYYRNIEESQHQVRSLRHDMANHLTTLAGLDGDAMRQYIHTLTGSAVFQMGRRYCENQIVNAVLSAKVPMLEENNIKFILNVILPENTPFSDVEICSLFANGLDNAIEANQKIPVADRNMELYTALDKGLFVLKLTNASSETIYRQGDKIVSSKKDKTTHGYGLAGMREIVRRYNGTLDIVTDSEKFELTILVPIEKIPSN